MSIREKVAREIRLAYCGKGAKGTWEKMTPELQAVWIFMADAAITAFLEAEQGWRMMPVEATEEMGECGRAAYRDPDSNIYDIFDAMYAAAPPFKLAASPKFEWDK